MSKSKTKACSVCGAEIAKSAKACPACGAKNKKPIYLRGWFIVLIVIVIGIAAAGGSDDSSSTTSTDSENQEVQEETIVYTEYSVSQLMKDLDENAMNASDTYKDQYVELNGLLNVIDSDGSYISITPEDDEWAIIGVQCYFQNDEQKDVVKSMTIGDKIVVKGQITEVGEVLGYSLDIDEVIAK